MPGKVQKTAKRVVDYASFLWAQRVTGLTVPDHPHMDEESTAWLLAEIPKATLYLEFGAGGSTVEAARLGVPTISVDSDPYFARTVLRKIGPSTSVTMLTPPIGQTREWGEPVLKRPRPKWRRYIDAAFTEVQRRGVFPDLILVDGRFRVACVLESIRQAKAAGANPKVFVDDYAGRDFYHTVERIIGKPKMVGRAALFENLQRVRVTPAEVEVAMQDYR